MPGFPLLDRHLAFAVGGVASVSSAVEQAEATYRQAFNRLTRVDAELELLCQSVVSDENLLVRQLVGTTALDDLFVRAASAREKLNDQVCAAAVARDAARRAACEGVIADAWLTIEGPSHDLGSNGGRIIDGKEYFMPDNHGISYIHENDQWFRISHDVRDSIGNVSDYKVAVDQGSLPADLQHSLGIADPLLVDVAGKGIALTSAADGVLFDIRGDGNKVPVAWTEVRGEGGKDTNEWLVRDDAIDGGMAGITSGRELFGDQHGDADGFARLRTFDENHDGVFDAKDSAFAQLALWQDRNHNGVAEDGELRSLVVGGIKQIVLAPTETAPTEDAHGNRIQRGRFIRET